MKNISPPYYAVIFSSKRTNGDHGYEKMSQWMEDLAAQQEGFLGVESARDDDGFGITISYWKTLDDIKRWKENKTHGAAQEKGKSTWYTAYDVKICKVERTYGFGFGE